MAKQQDQAREKYGPNFRVASEAAVRSTAALPVLDPGLEAWQDFVLDAIQEDRALASWLREAGEDELAKWVGRARAIVSREVAKAFLLQVCLLASQRICFYF